MRKTLTAVVMLLVLGAGGYFGFQQYQAMQARKARAAEVARLHALQVAADATRKDVEAQLKPMRVTSIIPGQPGLAIIDRKEYAEGDALPLPRGKALKITAVREDGVRLAYNGLAFRLDPPAAPDLEALRKSR